MLAKSENKGSYIIHFDRMPIEGANQEVMDILQQYANYLQKNKKGIIERLRGFIEKYPHIPQFKNYLYTALLINDYEEEARKVLEDTINKHPNYFFARQNKALLCISENDFEGAEALMGGGLPTDIQNMYPERKEFHISEVLSYCKYAIEYYLKKNEFDNATNFIHKIEKFIPQRLEVLDEIRNYQKRITFSRMTFNIERTQRLMEKSPKVDSKRKQFFEPSEDAPVFNHPEVENLYYHDFHIPKELLDKILSLPRTTLIEDLETLLADFQRRNEYFWTEVDNETSEYKWCFFFHPIFLLAELKSYDSLQSILNVFRQDEDFGQRWFGDYYEGFIGPLYQLAQNQLPVIAAYLKEENNETWTRNVVSEVPFQVALHQPERRSEIIEWYKDIFTYFVENKDNENLIDGDLIGSMVVDVLEMEGIELFDYIKPLYDNGLANEMTAGDWAMVEKKFQEFNFVARKYNLEATTYTLYQEILKPKPIEYMNEEKAAKRRQKFTGDNLIDKDELNILSELFGFAEGEDYEDDWVSNKAKPTLSLLNTAKTTHYGRNDKVTVRYENGRVEKDVKFKKIEDDWRKGLCEIIS